MVRSPSNFQHLKQVPRFNPGAAPQVQPGYFRAINSRALLRARAIRLGGQALARLASIPFVGWALLAAAVAALAGYAIYKGIKYIKGETPQEIAHESKQAEQSHEEPEQPKKLAGGVRAEWPSEPIPAAPIPKAPTGPKPGPAFQIPHRGSYNLRFDGEAMARRLLRTAYSGL